MFSFFKKIYHAFSDRHAQCLACDQSYAKAAMREIWYKYADENVERTSAVYLCEPCAIEITKNVEDAVLDDEPYEFEIETDDRT